MQLSAFLWTPERIRRYLCPSMTVKTAARSQGAISILQHHRAGKGVNSAWVRRVNAVLLMQALRRHPGSSQRELALLTGLDKATVSAVTSQLVDSGLVARCGASGSGQRLGRPAVALSIPRSAGIVLGVRFEPDKIEVVAADLGGIIVDRESRPGTEDPREAISVLQSAASRLRRRLGQLPLRAVGIGVPALIEASGEFTLAPNLHWQNVDMPALAAALLPAPAIIENDANAAAIAERAFGHCTEVDDFICVSGHSGIGGSIFAGGRLYRGANGLAGEFGHIRMVADGRPCACGGRGCLETYASVPGMMATLAERGSPARDFAEFAARAEAGDAVVRAILAETGVLFGRALAGGINALNPSELVLGGSIAVVGPWMLDGLRRGLAEVGMEQLVARVAISLSPLGADAVPMGGVALALPRVDAELMEAGALAG
jgi:predicted NBD/HSP70 family sugar kinase